MIVIGILIALAITITLWVTGRRSDKSKDNRHEMAIGIILICTSFIVITFISSYVMTNNVIGQKAATIRANKASIASMAGSKEPDDLKKIRDLTFESIKLKEQNIESNKSCRQLILFNCY